MPNATAIHRTSPARFELLESRQLYAVTSMTLDHGWLNVNCDAAADVVKVSAGTFTFKTSNPLLSLRLPSIDIYDHGVRKGSFLASAVITVQISGGDGNDLIDCRGLNVPAYLKGGIGDDVLLGGNKNDRLDGDQGRDAMSGFDGDDYFFDGNDADMLIDGGDGDDTLETVRPPEEYLQHHAVYNVETVRMIDLPDLSQIRL